VRVLTDKAASTLVADQQLDTKSTIHPDGGVPTTPNSEKKLSQTTKEASQTRTSKSPAPADSTTSSSLVTSRTTSARRPDVTPHDVTLTSFVAVGTTASRDVVTAPPHDAMLGTFTFLTYYSEIFSQKFLQDCETTDMG